MILCGGCKTHSFLECIIVHLDLMAHIDDVELIDPFDIKQLNMLQTSSDKSFRVHYEYSIINQLLF